MRGGELAEALEDVVPDRLMTEEDPPLRDDLKLRLQAILRRAHGSRAQSHRNR
jgi:hypothetical protein